MNKKSVLSIFFLSLIGMVFIFQNCSNPAPYAIDRTEGNSSSSNNEPVDTTPRLDLGGNSGGTPIAPLPLPPLYSSVQASGSDENERAWGIVQTSDGGFITAGRTKPESANNNAYQVLFKKFDGTGALTYSVRVGDAFEQQSYKAIEMLDAYLVVGLTRTVIDTDENRSSDILLVRINKSDGRVMESFRYGTTDVEALYDIVYAVDGSGQEGLVGVGFMYDRTNQYRSAIIVKFDLSLQIVWQRRVFSGSNDYLFTSLAYVPGRGYYATGFRQGQNRDAVIAKFTWAGILQNARISNNTGNEDSYRDVAHTGNQIVAAGRMNGNGRGGEGVIQYFDYNLVPQTTYIVGNAGGLDQFMDINPLPGGALVLSGMTNSAGGNNYDNMIVKISANKQIEFVKSYGSSGNDQNQYHSLVVRRDQGFAFITNKNNPGVAGTMSPTLYLVDQYGDIPAGCNGEARTAPQFQIQTTTTYSMNNINFTVQDLDLQVDPLNDIDETEHTPDSDMMCTN